MRNKIKFFVEGSVLIVFLALPIALAAADYDYNRYQYKTEVFGVIGTGSWSYDHAGLVLGGGFVLRPYPKAGFEINYKRLDTREENSFGSVGLSRFEQSGQSLTASVHYYFSEMQFQPYLLLGGGYAGTDSRSYYRDEESEQLYESTENGFILEAGGGVNIFLTSKFSVRPDVRLLIGSLGSVQGAINLCYHW